MTTPSEDDRTLILQRTIAAPRAAVYRCWTDPALIPLWFAPKPYGVSRVVSDLRPGGESLIVMTTPDGAEMPNPGVYLEVVPEEKLVFTDAYTAGWVPSAAPFMTGILTFADAGDGNTLYTATVRHFTAEGKRRHEEMGFHTGWEICTDQLEALARTL